METKRLIPYSVHLREDIYDKLKAAAKERKATALVRDAITLIVEGDDAFNGGYNKAIRDVISAIHEDAWCRAVGVSGKTFAEYIEEHIKPMIVHQNIKKKGKNNG